MRPHKMVGRGLLASTLAVLLVVAACGSGNSNKRAGSSSQPTTATSLPADPLLVTTDLGTVRGVQSAVHGVRAFNAMPYSAAPTGANRWRPPQPRTPYDGTLDASRPGPSCPQPQQRLAIYLIPSAAEDCLTVSVWAPDDAHGLPVLFWIHGGAMREGSAHQTLYIGDDLAASGSVVVDVNYRLGAFGFLATGELAAESGDRSVGNYGLADQRAALQWVRRNITAFGGDPGKVTIVGESSGGAAVCAHLASKASTGLFNRAIVESSSLSEGNEGVSETVALRQRVSDCNLFQTRASALARGAAFLSAAGCSDMACLRALPTETILATDFSPALVADGVDLSDTAQQIAARGGLNAIPVMIGSNGTEETLFTMGAPELTDEELFSLFAHVSDRPDELLALYPASSYPTNLDRFRTMMTDWKFACRARSFAAASTGKTFVYQYEYDSPSDPFGVGPTHGAEIIPLFVHPEGINGLGPITEAPLVDLSAAMQAAWVNFAATGNPGRNWEPYSKAKRATVLDDPIHLVDEIRGGRCDTVRTLTTGIA